MQKLYIVRHGKTDWNVQGLMQGSIDISLNAEGIKEAKDLAKTMDLSKIDICICSPLKRTKETAELIVGDKKKIIYDELLLERGFGDFEGKKIDFNLIFRQWDYKLNDKEGNIESIKDCLARAKKFLDKVKKEYPDKSILVISHGSFIKTLHFNIIGYYENTNFLSFNPKNTTLYEYNI